MPRAKVIRATATPITLTARDRDVTVVAAVADLVINLPPAGRGTKGNIVRVEVETLSTGTGCSLSPTSVDQIHGTGITAADNKDLINTAATDAVGDAAELVCDGDQGWRITNLVGTWARQA